MYDFVDILWRAALSVLIVIGIVVMMAWGYSLNFECPKCEPCVTYELVEDSSKSETHFLQEVEE